MDDTQIIDLYWDRDQGAITATAGKYGSFLHALSWNILRSHHDAEECVNDTYFRAWNAMPPERPSALRAWLGRITRNLSLDRWKACLLYTSWILTPVRRFSRQNRPSMSGRMCSLWSWKGNCRCC